MVVYYFDEIIPVISNTVTCGSAEIFPFSLQFSVPYCVYSTQGTEGREKNQLSYCHGEV